MAETVPEFTLLDRLAKARATAGLSQQELGSRLGLSRQAINSYETGRQAVPRATLIAWAAVCDVPLWWLTATPGDAPSEAFTARYWRVATLTAA